MTTIEQSEPRFDKTSYKLLLERLDVGSPIAEDDSRLLDARVETPVFRDLLNDSIDIVRGNKGSGKTALFRIFTAGLKNYLLENSGVALLRGVEVTGDPIFQKFAPHFQTLDELGFQNFWRIYFLSLINQQVFADPSFQSRVEPAKKEIQRYFKLAENHNLPIIRQHMSFVSHVGWVLSRLPKARKIKMTGTIEPSSGAPIGSIEIDGSESNNHVITEGDVPLFISEVHDALVRILDGLNLRVWIMLDRLDEVFPRRSDVERMALRALLMTTRSFRTPAIRIKIFLRDDIFEEVTNHDQGFPALSHVMGRTSQTLRWTPDQLLLLIYKRVFADNLLRSALSIDSGKADNDASYRENCLYTVLPPHVHGGKTKTMDWLYSHCRDGKDAVTPRDLIDLLRFSQKEQCTLLAENHVVPPTILSPSALRNGFLHMSKDKGITYLRAEFPHFWEQIQRFEGQKAEHDSRSLRRLLGANWERTADNLRAIGFLRHNAAKNTYTVPFLYRPCLSVRQGRDKKIRG